MMPSSRYRALAVAIWTLPSALACSDEAQVLDLPQDTGASAEDVASRDSGTAPVSDPLPTAAAPADTPLQPSTEPAPNVPDPEAPALPDPAAPVTAPRGACDSRERVGRFSIEKQVDFGVVQGTVNDGVVPTAIPTLVSEESGCRVLERRNLACAPGCVGAETCGESGTCIPYPRQVNVGEVSIAGLTRETRMSPQAPGASYFSPGADNPPYQVRSQITLSAVGTDTLPSFQLFGVGSEPLAEAPSWVLAAGTDLALAWAAPISDVQTHVLVELTIDQHGVSPLSLVCELEDTGSATVPAVIIDQLIGSGVTGFPNGRITRRTADHVQLDVGCVELVVGSPRAAAVSVSGFTPCNGPADCSNDQTCNLALQRCE
jgi:hypothetical protein